MNILIVTGGTSAERKISFMSAKAVKEALLQNNHQIKVYDLKKGYKNIKKLSKKIDVIFPIIHGEEGEGGKLNQFLQSVKRPFIGGDWKGYKKGWYKISFKKFCEQHDIPTAQWKKVKTKEDIIKFGFPSVLKSSAGGSSREVAILKSKEDLKSYLMNKLLKSKLALFVEEFLPGVEITVAVLQNQALPVIEIIPPEGGWFDYKNKYWGRVKEIPHAPSLDEKTRKLAQNFSLKIHKYFKLGQFSRTDFIVSNNKVYALEVNTIPGLTSSSLFPKAALAAGIEFPDLLNKILKLAMEKD